MTRDLILTLALAAASVAAPLGAALEAQVSAPNISAPKRAAQNAANRVNARTGAIEAAGATGQVIEGRSGQGAAQLAQAQGATAPAGQAKAPQAKAATPAAATTGGDTARATSVAQRGAKGEVTFQREQFAYDDAGRRDPFYSLFASGDLRPVLTDLRLVAVIYDPTGRNSVAILRDITTKDQYRVKTGQMLGRMRVTAILPKQINVVIDEFGYSRQESLALIDPTTQRTR